MKPSDQIRALAKLHTNLDPKGQLTAGILDYLDELDDADVGDQGAVMPVGAASLLKLLRDLDEAKRIAAEIRAPLPRGLVAVEAEAGTELWFTGEVFPPTENYENLSTLDVILPASGMHNWSDVDRWRFKS